MNKVIVRIQGGLGNQLFGYAAARRLALVNNAELVIDNVTGFVRDRRYRRKYQLHHFALPCRTATARERLEPLERLRRKALRISSQFLPFESRPYVAQESDAFDPRLLTRQVHGTVHLDGLWQSEQYFADVTSEIRKDLRIHAPTDRANQQLADRIAGTRSVALHVRWFEAPGTKTVINASVEYYRRAIATIERSVPDARYFVFSDHPEAAIAKLELDSTRSTLVHHNRGDDNAYADLWLMSQCRYFVTANSTFSWWGAWLSDHAEKLVVCPKVSAIVGAWNFEGQIPQHWIQM